MTTSTDPAALAPRALVVFADRHDYLLHQTAALYESLLHSQCVDTDLVCFGPADVLSRLPVGAQLRKIEQAAHRLAPGYGFINSIACFNGPGSEVLAGYRQLLKTDVDTFVTPAWTTFMPSGFLCGRGAYVHSQDVRDRLLRLAADMGLTHRGWHNLGSTLLGPPARVREVCALATRITEHLLETEFRHDPGRWPEWFRGVSSMYATELALNHLVPDLVQAGDALDFPSHHDEPTGAHPHLHCWQVTAHYSKLHWIDGLYAPRAESTLDLGRIPDFCLAMAQRALRHASTA